jgi:hypothetical protein
MNQLDKVTQTGDLACPYYWLCGADIFKDPKKVFGVCITRNVIDAN